MSSELIVKIVDVDKIEDHPNADRLDIATVGGWQCIVPKDTFKAGDSGLYIPIDSIIPYELECKIFGLESKVKLSKGRIKTIRLRQAISQGLLIRPETAGLDADIAVGTDVKEKLDIKKYEPPTRQQQNLMGGKSKTIRKSNENFKKYTSIQNVKNYIKVFEEGEAVSVTEKIHGCFMGETKVTLADGTKKTIKEIVNNRLDVEVLSMNSKGQLVPCRITNWFDNGTTKEWKNVKIRRSQVNKGSDIVSNFNTSNHEYWLPFEQKYKATEELVPGDSVMQTFTKRHLSNYQADILTGKMLGDGSLCNNSIDFRHKIDHEQYIDFTLSLLGDIAGSKGKEQESGFGTRMIPARSKSLLNITELFSEWFKEEKKEIPKNINFSPIVLAFWYMDDGSLSHSGKQKDRALFATCNFSEDSIDNLISAFKRFYNFNAVKHLSEEKYWRIRLNKDDADKFFKIISPYICDCMRYKLPEEYRNLQQDWLHICSDNQTYYTWESCCQNILSIEDVSKDKMQKLTRRKYDIETENHNYVANDILVHNSNFRAGYVPTDTSGWWNRFLVKFKLKSDYEFAYGSHNVQLHTQKFSKGTHIATNVYLEAVEKYNLKKILKRGEVVYGEVYGSSVQKNYMYGCKEGERKLVLFDIMVDGEYKETDYFRDWANINSLPIVPEIYRGPFNLQKIKDILKGNSVMIPSQKIIEGGVCKSIDGMPSIIGRKVLKFINDDYLLKDNTEFH